MQDSLTLTVLIIIRLKHYERLKIKILCLAFSSVTILKSATVNRILELNLIYLTLLYCHVTCKNVKVCTKYQIILYELHLCLFDIPVSC
jgi:hypothetical protein